eukprot:scaffold250280_cov14-Tisochrysis_lutea.AAC.1
MLCRWHASRLKLRRLLHLKNVHLEASYPVRHSLRTHKPSAHRKVLPAPAPGAPPVQPRVLTMSVHLRVTVSSSTTVLLLGHPAKAMFLRGAG